MAGIALVLVPFDRVPFVRYIVRVVTAPIDAMLTLLEYAQILNWSIMVFIIVYGIPVIGWKVFELVGWAPVVPEKAYTYGSLVFTAVVFTHWGGSMTMRTTGQKRRQKYGKVFGLLRPNYIRVAVYGLMAVAYIAANLEKFSGMTITSADWWTTYKDVLVEVLLTYTAIDGVIVTWKERNGEVAKSE